MTGPAFERAEINRAAVEGKAQDGLVGKAVVCKRRTVVKRNVKFFSDLVVVVLCRSRQVESGLIENETAAARKIRLLRAEGKVVTRKRDINHARPAHFIRKENVFLVIDLDFRCGRIEHNAAIVQTVCPVEDKRAILAADSPERHGDTAPE